MSRTPGGSASSGGIAQRRRAETIYEAPTADGDLLQIRVDEIAPNPFNERDGDDDIDQGFIESIKENGVLQAVSVMSRAAFLDACESAGERESVEPRIEDAKYVLVFGERRWRGSRLAEIEEIPAVLRDDVAPRMVEILILENLQRRDFRPLQEARAFQKLKDRGLSHRTIAQRVGCSPGHVTKRLSLLTLPSLLQAAVDKDSLKVTDALLLVELETLELMQEAWGLMQSEEQFSARAAVSRVMAGPALPPPPVEETGESAAGARAPQAGGLASIPAPTPADAEFADAGEGEEAAPAQVFPAETQKAPAAAAPDPKVPRQAKAAEPEDSQDDARETSAEVRRSACAKLLGERRFAEAAEITRRLAIAVIDPHKQSTALRLAAEWLEASAEQDPLAAALASADPKLLTRAAFAVALAQDELRAADHTRTEWDGRDAAYISMLVKATGYQPADWEQALLKSAVPAPVSA